MDLKIYLKQNRGITRVIAKEIGVTTQCVRDWCKHRIPAERVFSIYLVTGGMVTPTEMRPDIYPHAVGEFVMNMLDSGSDDV